MQVFELLNDLILVRSKREEKPGLGCNGHDGDGCRGRRQPFYKRDETSVQVILQQERVIILLYQDDECSRGWNPTIVQPDDLQLAIIVHSKIGCCETPDLMPFRIDYRGRYRHDSRRPGNHLPPGPRRGGSGMNPLVLATYSA